MLVNFYEITLELSTHEFYEDRWVSVSETSAFLQLDKSNGVEDGCKEIRYSFTTLTFEHVIKSKFHYCGCVAVQTTLTCLTLFIHFRGDCSLDLKSWSFRKVDRWSNTVQSTNVLLGKRVLIAVNRERCPPRLFLTTLKSSTGADAVPPSVRGTQV